jgi:hypothetical protein
MKRLWAIVVFCLAMAALAAPVGAWEFHMQGKWLWGYDYIEQSGRNGFFGAYDTTTIPAAAPSFAKFSSMNAWVGARDINAVQYGMVTGSNASLQWSRMELHPELRINQALRLRGVYQIGGPAGPYSLYQGGGGSNSTFGAWSPMSVGQWTQWWMTAQLPWGVVVMGKRPFAWGCGAQYDSNNASNEGLMVIAPYGPFRLGGQIFPYRGNLWINAFPQRIGTAPPANGQTQVSYTFGSPAPAIESYRPWDQDAKFRLEPGIFFTYENGPLSLGALYEWTPQHSGPAGGTTSINVGIDVQRTYDQLIQDGSAFVKYNNGRFFANMELAWLSGDVRIQPGIADADIGNGLGSRFAPYNLEAWKWFMELGALCGPAKVSFLWSWVPGPDRRQGVWINKQSWENAADGAYLGNADAFKPYSLIMGYQYGAGLLATSFNGEGYMTDANTLAARLDYAAAANLHLYGTFMYATRVSNGWPVGCLTMAGDAAANGGGSVILLGQQFGPWQAAYRQAASIASPNPAPYFGLPVPAPQNGFNGFAPNIPDNALGWEINAGVDWKLLEGLTSRFRVGYWQPGDWFKYACVDKNVSTTVGNIYDITGVTVVNNYAAPNAGPNWGINPSKSIDPIWMFQGTVEIDL